MITLGQRIFVHLRRTSSFNVMDGKGGRISLLKANGFVGKIEEGSNPECLVLKLESFLGMSGHLSDVLEETPNVIVAKDNIDLIQLFVE